jgi:uncharacterized protein YecE (DUF72 family)
LVKEYSKGFSVLGKAAPNDNSQETAGSLPGVEIDLNNFLDLMKPLNEAKKLGPLLIQIPPSFAYSKIDRLEQFFEILPKEFSFAIEFRNKPWFEEESRKDDLYSLLSRHNVSNTIVDEPLLPVDLTVTSKEFTLMR